MANWFSQMFTPQRQGPGQMVWQDIVNEQSGEFSTGDMQEQVWKPSVVGSNYVAGPTTRRKPAQPMQNPQSQEGTGLSAKQDFMAGMDRLENEGMDDSWGASRAQDYGAGPSGSIGASIAESMNPSTMTPGSSRWSGVSMNDNWIQDPYQAPNAFQAPTPGLGDVEGMNISATDITSSDPLYRDRIQRAGGNVTFPDENPNPSVPPGIAQLMKLFGGMGSGISSLFSPSQAGAGSPGPTTPRLRRGQLGPLSAQGQEAVSASQASAPWGRDRLGRPRLHQMYDE